MKYRVIEVKDYVGNPYYIPQYKKFFRWKDCTEFSCNLGQDYVVSFMEKTEAIKYVKALKVKELLGEENGKKRVVYSDSVDAADGEIPIDVSIKNSVLSK